MTMNCFLLHGKEKFKVRILLDTGSTVTLINRSTALRAGLVGKSCQLNLMVVGGRKKRTLEQEVEFRLQSLDHSFTTNFYTATTCKIVTTVSPVKLDLDRFPHLKNVNFTEHYPQTHESVIDILADVEIFWDLVTKVVKPESTISQPSLVVTKLGNVLAGAFIEERSSHAHKTLPNAKKHKKFSLLTHKHDVLGETDEYYQRFMNLEDLGVVERDSELTKDDEEAVRLMKQLTKYDPNKQMYETGLLWKLNPRENLDSNYAPAKRIAMSAKKKSIQHEKQDQVNAAYKEQILAGFAEEVPRNEIITSNPTYYIPTHPIYRPDRLTTKTRIVMNASAKCRTTGKSLNDCVYQGPTLLPDLVKILLNFRMHKYVSVTDISKMFWKVRIRPPDSDCLRYLWQWEDDGEVKAYRALSVTFGVVSSPFQAIWTVLHHCDNFESQFPMASKSIKDTLYMDDVSILHDNFDEAKQTTKEIYDLLMLASMQPHKWNSNNTQILKEAGIPEEFWANVQNQKILGLEWDAEKDNIEFNF